MAAYGDLRFMDEAVDSILSQNYQDFEFIIVDDATPTPELFDRLALVDPRIRIIHNPDNLGAAGSANWGIVESRGDIVARIDSDDVAEPARLERLVAAFEADPSLGLIGSWYIRIDVAGVELAAMRPPTSDWELRWQLLFHNPFCHSTMAFRRSAFEASGRYNETMRSGLDADLWYRMIEHCRAACLPAFLARYRVNPSGISATNPSDWRTRTDAHRRRLWQSLGVGYPADIVADMTQFVCGWDVGRTELRSQVYRSVLQILHRFAQSRGMPARGDEGNDRHRVIETMITRVLTDSTTGFVDWCRLWRIAWHIDPWTAANGAVIRAGAFPKVGRDALLHYASSWLRRQRGVR